MTVELREALDRVLARLDRRALERHVGRPVTETAAALWAELWPAIVGWPKWFAENPEAVYRHEADLRWVLHDLRACARCDGQTCRALINRDRKVQQLTPGCAMYYAIAPAEYGPPRFAFFGCGSPALRRAEALEQLRRAQEAAREVVGA